MKNNIFGRNFKSFRQACHKNQQEVANALGICRTRVSNWELGNIEPDLDMLIAIVKYFDTTYAELLEE